MNGQVHALATLWLK